MGCFYWLASGKHWDDVPKLEETSTDQSASEGCKAPYLKCFYTNSSMRNKPDELKTLAQYQRFDTTGTGKTWWEESCGCSVLLGGYRFFRRGRQAKRGWGWHCMQWKGYNVWSSQLAMA